MRARFVCLRQCLLYSVGSKLNKFTTYYKFLLPKPTKGHVIYFSARPVIWNSFNIKEQ